MKTDPGSEFTIWGDLRIQAQEFKVPTGAEDKNAQILCFADISYRHRWYHNILFIKLDIEGSEESGWNLNEDIPLALPYLKPVPAFRGFLIEQFNKFLDAIPEADKSSPFSPIWTGVNQFIGELARYDEIRALLGQVRNEVDRLQRRLKNERHSYISPREKIEVRKIASRLLKVLGCTPRTEQDFMLQGPLL